MPDPTGFQRRLGPFDTTCVVIGAIIGVGIFFTPSFVARITGSAELALATWGVGGVIALLGALTFAELGGLYPRAGGQYDALRDALGAPFGFLYGFCNLTAIQAGAVAIIAIICARHVGVAVNGAPFGETAEVALAVVIIGGLAGANILGVRWGASIQNLTVVAKVATLLLVTVIAALAEPAAVAETPTSLAPGTASPWGVLLIAGLVPTLFSFGGWQQGLWMGGEVRDAERTVPRSIVLGVVVVVAVYLLVNWGYFRLLGFDGVAGSKTLASDAVSVVWPHVGTRIVAAAVALSSFGVLNAQFLAGPRLTYAMARDGKFFRAFGRLHGSFGTPVAATLLLGTIAVVLLLVAGFNGVDQLLTGVVLIDAAFFALTGASLVILRRKAAGRERPVRVPLYPWVPLLFVAGEVLVVIGALRDESTQQAVHLAVIWVIGGLVAYCALFRRKRDCELTDSWPG